MSIRFQCPICKSVLESPEHKAGSAINCPKCTRRLQVPPVQKLAPVPSPPPLQTPAPAIPSPPPAEPPLEIVEVLPETDDLEVIAEGIIPEDDVDEPWPRLRPVRVAWWRKPPFYTVPALVLAVASLPLAIVVSLPALGVVLASVALALAIGGCMFALALRGTGLWLGLISLAVSGSFLFVAIVGFPGIGKI